MRDYDAIVTMYEHVFRSRIVFQSEVTAAYKTAAASNH
jgi:hypothetical protein